MNQKYSATVIFAIVVVSILLIACDKNKTLKSNVESETPTTVLTRIVGLRLDLPGQPQKAEFSLSKSAMENTVSQDSYVLQNGSTQYGLCKTVHHVMNDSLEDNARGIVDGYKDYSIVDIQVAGIMAKRITMEIALDENTQYLSILLFSRGKTLWQIATIDPSITKAHTAMDTLIPTIQIAK